MGVGVPAAFSRGHGAIGTKYQVMMRAHACAVPPRGAGLAGGNAWALTWQWAQRPTSTFPPAQGCWASRPIRYPYAQGTVVRQCAPGPPPLAEHGHHGLPSQLQPLRSMRRLAPRPASCWWRLRARGSILAPSRVSGSVWRPSKWRLDAYRVASPSFLGVTGPSLNGWSVVAERAATRVHMCGRTSTELTSGDPRVVEMTKGSHPQAARGFSI